mgnify:CR=1 FL=1|jgi:hypothetical protein
MRKRLKISSIAAAGKLPELTFEATCVFTLFTIATGMRIGEKNTAFFNL